MNTITVHTEPKSIEQSKNQAITGLIFFDFGHYQFPEKGWNDFIVVVLSWWLAAFENIILDSVDNEELRFMDGPLYVTVKKLDKDIFRIGCFNEKMGNGAEFSGEYSITEIINAVLNVAKTVESVCSKNGWDTDEIRWLKVAIKKVARRLE